MSKDIIKESRALLPLSSHIYIYYVHKDGKDNAIIYDRSMPRNAITEVDYRIDELRKRGLEPFYVIGDILPRAFV